MTLLPPKMNSRPWWKTAVVYQVYPRSFMDASGDGIGDLQGVILKLDYLKQLGIDVIWLNPIYDSPNDDNGYDIRDYYQIMSDFGTMEDFDRLLFEAHQRGIRIVMDLVVNHTSDEHPWFIESKASEENPYRHYYFWQDQPNNWGSIFGGSAWEQDPTTKKYYLHLFSRKQPDLNWENSEVREEVYRLMKFWLDKGIDGFRMDVINAISKVPGLPDGEIKPGDRYASGGEFYMNGPRVHEFLQEMYEKVLSHYDIMTVGEAAGTTPEQALLYTAPERHELNMVFQFEHMDIDAGPRGKWDIRPLRLTELKAVLSKWQEKLHNRGWNSLYLNNHDQPRMVSRFGNDKEYRVESAKMLATILHFLQGTPYIYQGEEIGMTNVAFPSIDDYQDVEIKNMWQERVIEGKEDPEAVLSQIHVKGRGNARTPMQWSDSLNAGFSTGDPWMKVNPNYVGINVEQALNDRHSIFYYYQALIRLRKDYDVITDGKYHLLLPDHETIFAYLRETVDELVFVAANFSGENQAIEWPEGFAGKHAACLIANYEDTPVSKVGFTLRPYEARVYHLRIGA